MQKCSDFNSGNLYLPKHSKLYTEFCLSSLKGLGLNRMLLLGKLSVNFKGLLLTHVKLPARNFTVYSFLLRCIFIKQ